MNNPQIYSPEGIINQANQGEFQQQLAKVIEKSPTKDILIDFKKVELVDSSGLMALINAYKQAKNRNKNLYLFNVSPSVKMIFEISQLDKVLGIKDNKLPLIIENSGIAA